jgi:hypothetical protein
LWARGLNAKDIYKEKFRIYGEKYLSHKAVHSWDGKRDKYFADDEEVETEMRKWLRQQSNTYTLLVSTRWNKRINVGGRYIEK